MKQNNLEMIPVPLPTEVPPPPNLDNIPLDILHSATVEMLIQQNDDLSSRLKVNIRRNSQLEQRLIENEKEMANLNRQRENVLAQMEIIKEKQNIWSHQKEKIERQNQALQQESELLERRYNELFTTSKQQEKERRGDLAASAKKIRDLEEKATITSRIRTRAKEKLRSFLLEMAENFNRQQKQIHQAEASNRLLKKQFEQLNNETSEKETFFRQQLENLKQTSQKALASMDCKITQLQEDNSRLKSEKTTLSEEISDLQHRLHDEKKLRIKLSNLSSELSEIKNDRIRLKRESQSAIEKSESSRLLQASKAQELNKQLETLQRQRETDQQTLKDCEKQILELAKDNEEISEQLSSLQNLWVTAQARLEKEELKSQALEKINRQLSQDSQASRVSRSAEQAQKKEELPTTVEPNNSDNSEFQDRIQQVFASQYRTTAKGPELDV